MNASDKPVTHGELETILDKAFAKFALQMGDMFADFAAQIDGRLTKIESRLDSIEARLDSVEATQQQHSAQLAEINQRLDNLERHTTGLEDDVTHLYKLVEELKKDIKNNHRAESQYHNRLELAEANLNRVMLRTGVNPA